MSRILPAREDSSLDFTAVKDFRSYRAFVQRTPSRRSRRHIVAHSASCGLAERGRKARECGRHSLGIYVARYVARIRGLEPRAILPTAGAVGYNMPPATLALEFGLSEGDHPARMR